MFNVNDEVLPNQLFPRTLRAYSAASLGAAVDCWGIVMVTGKNMGNIKLGKYTEIQLNFQEISLPRLAVSGVKTMFL